MKMSGTQCVVAILGAAYIIGCAIQPALLWLLLVPLFLIFA